MRIRQLTPRVGVEPRLDDASDRGAVAAIVALLAVVLFGLAAFAVDLGAAYSSKRQLSVAADSAALAAAQEVSKALPPGAACSPSALQPTAASAASLANAQNDRAGGSTVSAVTVTCSNDDIQVSVTNTRTVNAVFGRILGRNSYQPSGTATAQLYVPQAVAGLRPIAACASTIYASVPPGFDASGLPNGSVSTAKPFLVYVSKDDAVCGSGGAGQWGFTNFLDQGSAYGTFNDPSDPAYNPSETCSGGSPSSGANAGCQSMWTDQGYGGLVWFPNRAVSANTGLAGSSGLANSSGWNSAFDGLADDVIQLPVAITYTSGDRLDIVGVITVRVCSTMHGSTLSMGTGAYTGTPNCSTSRTPSPTGQPAEYAAWSTLKNNEAALWVVPTTFATTGVSDPRAGCFQSGTGNCDFGTRAVRLYK